MSAMSTFTVNWNKTPYSIPFSPTAGVPALRQSIQDATGVPIARQKIMPKTKKTWKGILKDDFDLSALPPPPLECLLMGSAETCLVSTVQTIFIEDLKEDEKAAAGAELPAGLVNLGNTCYMNSTLQCLRYSTEWREGLAQSSTQNQFNRSLTSTFAQSDASINAIPPVNFWSTLKSTYPQFGEQGRQGGFAQQDAQEFLVSLFQSTNQVTDDAAMTRAFGKMPSVSEMNGAVGLTDAMFGMKLRTTLTCQEAGEAEPAVVQEESQSFLQCNIQGGHGSKIQIDHLAAGINLGLDGGGEDVEKHSEVLGRNALWQKKSRLDRLPKFLCVQMMRFFWKATPDSADHQGVKCKMLKAVTFGETLDAYEFCTDRVQGILKGPRDKKAAEDEERAAKKLRGDGTGDVDMKDAGADEDMDEEMDEEMKAALKMSMEEGASGDKAGPGLPDEFQGIYELYAVVCHKGRDSSSGHYTGWVRIEGDNWLVFDDDEVVEKKTKDIVELKGGGDWHMSEYRVRWEPAAARSALLLGTRCCSQRAAARNALLPIGRQFCPY